MTDQRDALIRLLRDDDPETLALVKAQLARRGPSVLPEVHAMLSGAEPAVARHLRDVIAQIEAGDAETAFTRLCIAFGHDGDLEEAAWKLAAIFLPGHDFSHQRTLLGEWSAEVSRRLEKAETELDRVETLIEFLGDEIGLRGNEDDYYNISNSLLPEVIDTRLGIPISLSLIYILIGRRVGIEIFGVGLPGHFLIRSGEHFFDPFFGGRRIGLEDCRERLERQSLKLVPSHLLPVPAPQFLLRMLNNICVIAEESDPPLAAKISSWMDLLRAASPPI
jgi:regulator of sirC expression with transglutaminase-like and TPR domain